MVCMKTRMWRDRSSLLALIMSLTLGLTLGGCSEEELPTERAGNSPPGALPVASLTVSPGSVSVAEGDSVQLSATTSDSARNVLTGRLVTWSGDDLTLVAVDTRGMVRGLAAGTATRDIAPRSRNVCGRCVGNHRSESPHRVENRAGFDWWAGV